MARFEGPPSTTARGSGRLFAVDKRDRWFLALVVPQHRLEHLLRLGVELVTLAKAEAAIPAKKSVVVAWSSKPFGLLEGIHCPTNPVVSNRSAPQLAL